MRSTFGGLNTMVRGINSSQLSLDTTGHNITNANTEGYSRQRVNVATTRSQSIYGFYGSAQLGTGVDAVSITRARDAFADKQFWKESSNTYYSMAKQAAYDKIEGIYDEVESNGLQTTLGGFWQSWKTLSASASDDPTRVVVRDKGKQTAELMQSYTKQLRDLADDNAEQIELKVNTVNQLTSQIYDLNKQIFKLETTGGMANDLRDSRDLMVDKLSSYINVSVNEMPNGTYSISSGGNILVDGNSYQKLATKSSFDKEYGIKNVEIVMEKTGSTFVPENGDLKGLRDSIKETKQYIDDMAKMSAYLLTTFNDAHRAGFGLNDSTGVNFFGTDGKLNADGSGTVTYEYDGVTKTLYKNDHSTGQVKKMTTLEIIQELTVNARFDETNGTELIAAKTQPGTSAPGGADGENTASGNNAVILGDLLNVHSKSQVLGNVTLMSYYTGMMGKLGISAESTDKSVTTQENIMTQINNWRGGVSGVNWDEELTDMIRFQTAYKSCSRCLTAMDEMLDKLINSTGVVGR